MEEHLGEEAIAVGPPLNIIGDRSGITPLREVPFTQLRTFPPSAL